MTGEWTAEREDTLRRMWAEGKSASAIARELGGVTRNGVIGKVHRLGNRPADAVVERPSVRVIEVPYPTSNSGVPGKARVTLPREPWV